MVVQKIIHNLSSRNHPGEKHSNEEYARAEYDGFCDCDDCFSHGERKVY